MPIPIHTRQRRSLFGGLKRAAVILLLAAGLSACGPKQGGGSNSRQGAGSPRAATTPTPLPPMSDSNVTPSPDRKLFKSGEVVPAGYLGLKVNSSWFTDHLTGKDKESGRYLFVDLNLVNTDRKERSVGPLKLVDEKGTEYGLSARAATVEQSAGQIGNLPPSVSKRAFAIFEVSVGHQYKLKVQGFSATDVVLIDLSPAATAPTH